MVNLMKCSVPELLKIWYDNREDINKYLQNRRNTKVIEGFSDNDAGVYSVATVAGVGIGMFVLIVLVSLAIGIWSIVAFVKYSDKLSKNARMAALIFLILGFLFLPMVGPIVCLIIVYSSKKK